jgi:hypothetical protein
MNDITKNNETANFVLNMIGNKPSKDIHSSNIFIKYGLYIKNIIDW